MAIYLDLAQLKGNMEEEALLCEVNVVPGYRKSDEADTASSN